MNTPLTINWTAVAVGAVIGFVHAVKYDVDQFKAWKTWNEAATYNWSTASFRWFQGIITYAVMATGLTKLAGW